MNIINSLQKITHNLLSEIRFVLFGFVITEFTHLAYNCNGCVEAYL